MLQLLLLTMLDVLIGTGFSDRLKVNPLRASVCALWDCHQKLKTRDMEGERESEGGREGGREGGMERGREIERERCRI